MDAVKVIKPSAEKAFVARYGDVLCSSGRYLATLLEGCLDWPAVPLVWVHPNPWRALKIFRVNTGILEKQSRYSCPYTGYEHYGVVPTHLVSRNLERYRSSISRRSSTRHNADAILDHEFHRAMDDTCLWKLTGIQSSLLGIGYTYGTGIDDGYASKERALVYLSNNDLLHVWTLVWHNK